MLFTAMQKYLDGMKALGYVRVGAHWYHPVRKSVRIEGRFTQNDYSAAKEAWLENPDLSEHRFPFAPVGGTVEMVNDWTIEITPSPVPQFPNLET